MSYLWSDLKAAVCGGLTLLRRWNQRPMWLPFCSFELINTLEIVKHGCQNRIYL